MKNDISRQGRRNEKKAILTEQARNNHMTMIGHTMIVIVMLTFVFLQVASGMKSGLYMFVMLVFGAAPVVAERISWKKDYDTKLIKHIAGFGFATFYTITLFTSTNNLVFAFAVPMVMTVTVYKDAKYIVLISMGMVVESVLLGVLGAKTGGFGFVSIDNVILQVVVMVLISIYSYYTTRTMIRNNDQRVGEMAEAQETTNRLLEDISDISQQLKDGITEIDSGLKQLDESAAMTKQAMAELASGAADTSDAVQTQTIQTQAIQERVGETGAEAEDIMEKMQHTLQMIENGNRAVQVLVETTETSVKNGNEVNAKLKTLETYMEQMNSIVALINNVASQTTMLSLNASIEAARAGESGRGFAVVATQISQMAQQTKDATVNITELIDNVTGSIDEVVSVVSQMIEGIARESESTEDAAVSFSQIKDNATGISENIERLAENIDGLKHANEEIVEVVQTISSNAGEVSAHAETTMEAEEQNTTIRNSLQERVHGLMQLIRE